MAETKKNQKIKSILLDLNTTDPKKLSKVIKSIESHGDPSVIRPLAQKLMTDLSDKNKGEIVELLSSLKDTSTATFIMDIICDEEYKSIRQTLLSTVWNMKVDFSDYLSDFVEIAVDGDFVEALDCLTIIENLEGPFMEEDIMECQLHLKKYRQDSSEKDDQKTYILGEIALKIQGIDESLID